MEQPTDSELTQQVLEVVARTTGPIGRFDIADALDPAARDRFEDDTSPEYDAFARRRIAIIGAAVRAEQAGLLECVQPATGGESDLLQLSARGREHLR